ncbi:hypothetical protein [Paeniglutamicibacter terrestris]|uniref:Uncharacterized protein n=1 Tax=Paeniglutamicibacter terrestris TaxID=2723403 RepID=A0ABX1G0P4_9MICC|nr:hypothetical protein [Paeniglutamicibacter terrestris]NKG19806.1 hypothetical protein [Paeniglutamicibacter terrestris]
MIEVGWKSVRTSDISGEVLADDKVITVVIRSEGKLFDVWDEELIGLMRLTNVVEIEFRHADGSTEVIMVNKSDFDQIVTPEVLAVDDNIRGRRKGFKPTAD